MAHREIIEDICNNCNNGGNGYCTLKEIVLHSGISDRTLEQLKLVEMFKWNTSAKEGKDIGWQSAWDLYTSEGYATRFAEVYKDGMLAKELYKLVFGEEDGRR